MIKNYTSYLAEKRVFPTLISQQCNADTKLIIVIPVRNMESIIDLFDSLNNCDNPDCSVEIISVFYNKANDYASAKAANKSLYEKANIWKNENQKQGLTFHNLFIDRLPKKQVGFGLVRKIGMDEAIDRFLSIEKPGILACLNADCTVERNYLVELINHFDNNKTSACSIYAEFTANEAGAVPTNIKIQQELYLRYYISALKLCGLPFAYHTLGYALAVSSGSYVKVGGMNKKKEGEDFYIAQKLISQGEYSELNSTTIYKSNALMYTFPFGSESAMKNAIDGDTSLKTYDFNSFKDLLQVESSLENIYCAEKIENVSEALKSFVSINNFDKKIEKLKANSKNFHSFRKSFYEVFSGMRTIQFLHFARDQYYSNKSLLSQARILLREITKCNTEGLDLNELLQAFRQIEKEGICSPTEVDAN